MRRLVEGTGREGFAVRDVSVSVQFVNSLCRNETSRKGGRTVSRRTGFSLAKQSINLPIVNGIDNDTVDDTSNNPTANESPFRSGLASATSLRKEEREAEVEVEVEVEVEALSERKSARRR